MPRKVTTNRHPSKRPTGPLPYVPCRHLLTPGERRFYHSGLLPAVGARWIIAFKVRLADVITAENFHSRLRDEFLALEEFENLAAARQLNTIFLRFL